jgi:hypothetical protein
MSIVPELVRGMYTKTEGWDRFKTVPMLAKHDERIPERSVGSGLLSPAKLSLLHGELTLLQASRDAALCSPQGRATGGDGHPRRS